MNKLTRLFDRDFIGQTVGTALLVLILALVTGNAALAATPPDPTDGSATVDGSYGEWNLGSDFFADMVRAGNPDKQIESYLYLRYDCTTATGYALVLATTGVDVLMQPGDAFVKLGNSTKLVDGNSPNFAWVQPNAQTGRAQGWEASFSLVPGSYSNLNVHVQVYDEGAQTSAVAERSIPLTIDCSSVTPEQTSSETPTETPSLPGPSFGSCYNPDTQIFRLTAVNKAEAPAYIGYDIYGKANSFVSLGSFAAGESKTVNGAQEGTLRKYISADGQNWTQKGGTHVLSVAGHTASSLLCKGSIEACKFQDDNANGIQEPAEISLGNWSMAVYAGTVDENEQPIATGVTDPSAGFVTFDRLLPGEYTVCEGQVEGWLPTIALCRPVTVTSEQAASVTFGNVPGGRIIVDKNADPADAPDKFDFSLTNGETTVASFALSGADTPFDSGLMLPGAYTLAEVATAGWDLADVTCVDTASGTPVSALLNPVTIALQAGQTVQCTFTNVKQPVAPETGSLAVTKDVVWGDVTPDEAQQFNICLSGPSFPTGSEDGACQGVGYTGGNLLWTELLPGSYMVAEIYPGIDWSVTGSGVDVTVTAGNQAQHTVTNTAEADVPPPPPVDPELGSLVVTKIVDWNGHSPVDTQTFNICIAGPSFPTGSESGACQDVGFYGGNLPWDKLIVGTYTVIESDPGVDWTVSGSGADVNVVKDEQAAHTIVNTASQQPPVEPKTGNLAVTKQVIWGEVPMEDLSFEICISGPSFPNSNETGACYSFGQNGGTHTWTDLLPGTYVVTEIGIDADLWTVTGSGSSVVVVAEHLSSHTVKNTAIDVGGEGGRPTALDPTDEHDALTARLYLPAVQR